MNIAVIASGNGTNLQALIDAAEAGRLDVRVAVVISNKSRSGALARAEKHNIPGYHLSTRRYPVFNDLDRAICGALKKHQTDYVFLAGYLKKIGPAVLAEYDGKILNTHPALLPDFGGRGMYGMNVHRAVIESGCKTSGVTVHLVSPEYDEGRIIAQAEVPVIDGDTPQTLCERVMQREREFVAEVLDGIAKGTIRC